jgi:hypothetical protein
MATATTTTEVRLLGAKDTGTHKKSWRVQVTHREDGGETIAGPPIDLEDPFTSEQYSKVFKFFVDDSFNYKKYPRSDTKFKRKLFNAEIDILGYRKALIRDLGLDRAEYGQTERNILVVEELETANEDKSFHTLVWELLESPSYWTSAPTRVNITRIVCPKAIEESEDARKGLSRGKPIRILLVIGRSLVKNQGKFKERVDPGMIQQPLMQIIQHLDEIGHHRRVQLEILRPSTFEELRKYLGVGTDGPKEYFDIIHLDMHGEMMAAKADRYVLVIIITTEAIQSNFINRDKLARPHLVFTRTDGAEIPPETSAAEIAEALKDRTKMLVMNACNSSSLVGGPGVNMVRTFLKKDISCVSATSFRLQEDAAKIYYPVFYMSLLLSGSFNEAAAQARMELRKNLKRYKGEERDDHFVHWNWSSTPTLREIFPSSPSFLLFCKMSYDMLCLLISALFSFIFFSQHAWHSSRAQKYSFHRVHRNFDDLKCHIQTAKEIDIPSITFPILELEYWLVENPKNSVYLHPEYPRPISEQQNIERLSRNMVKLWIRTNFVSFVRIVSVPRMLDDEGLLRATRWLQDVVDDFRGRSGVYRRESKEKRMKQPKIKNMLVIEGFEKLEPEKGKGLSPDQQNVLDKITQIVKDMVQNDKDMYLITIGALGKKAWEENTVNHPPILGDKWAGAQTMMLPQEDDVKIATYRRGN